MPLMLRKLKQLRVELAAFSEVRRPCSGTNSVGGYAYYGWAAAMVTISEEYP